MSLAALLAAIWTHPANRGARLSAIRRFATWQVYKRLTGRPITIDYHGLKLVIHPDSHSASKALYFSGLPDYREMRFILDYLRPGDHFVDVGANIGLYTLLAASIVGPTGHVHAFEPGRIPATRLEEAIESNGLSNVTLHRIAASDTTGTVYLEATEDDCTARVRETLSPSAHDAISTVRLDEYLPEATYSMFKLDIEGYEPSAIRGAEGMLRTGNPPVLQLEAAGYSENYGVTTADLIRQLDSLGFDCKVYSPDIRQLTPTDSPWEVPVEDVLAIHRKSLTVVERRILDKHGSSSSRRPRP